MYIMYIDESGDTSPISQGGKKFLVLTGCIIEENDKKNIEQDFRAIKTKYYQDPDIEIKSNFLRYANPDLAGNSPLKLNDRNQYNQLETDIKKLLLNINAAVYAVIIHKEGYWGSYPAQNPYDAAYMFLLERFEKYLEQKSGLGISIIDPREGQVEKHFMNDDLSRVHENLRWGEGFWYKCPRIIEKALFAESDKTIGIQLADLYCYPIFNVFEYDKTRDSYWRFSEVTNKKLVTVNGRVDGIGLKFFPEQSKKGLNFFK